MLAGNWLRQSWAQPAREADVLDVKGLLEAVADRLGVPGLHYRPLQPRDGVEHPGRSAGVHAGEGQTVRQIGRVGELHPRLLAAVESRAERAAFALIEVASLSELSRGVTEIGRLPRLPVAERDMAVVVKRDVAQSDVARVISQEAGSLLERLSLFDRYHGPPLERDEVSLAYRLRFQPMERPFAEGELEEMMDRIARRLAEALHARVRGSDAGVD